MKKILQLSLIALLVLLMAAVVMLAGCTSSGQEQNAQQGSPPSGNGRQANPNRPYFGNRTGGPGGNIGNLTDAQRQQLFQQRMQQAVAACEGKTAGESCALQNARGNMTGTCQSQNSTLLCMGGFGGRSGQFNRSAQ
ncbi:Uncharacterised protein [uncultured archaeon]|nr:Uncharacterised protein [uncultured archaeon]